MVDMLRDAMVWLEGQRTEHMSRTVTYQRGVASVELSATIGRTPFEVDRGDGMSIQIESRDYIVNTADLILSGSETLPLPGDRILEIDGDKQFTYEVAPPLGSEPAYRYTDGYRISLRIHTKLITVGAAP